MSGETNDNYILICDEGNMGQSSIEDKLFDEIIGHIEDILLEDDFHAIQKKFLDNYWDVFEPAEENKLIYTNIFNEYTKAVENYIVNYLQKVIPDFNINTFLKHLNNKQNELEGEVFEVLSTFTDFMSFKEMFLDYRAMKEGKIQDLSYGISITSLKSCTYDNNSFG
ncbi:hypothetical protein E2986_09147 [Frieseomelitta varia]|uniref:ADP-ribosylation factor-like protein 2-binding protein n=2 Tax=Meliponini TaxID=83319 RepID=A0A833W9B4_9HYME|nr:ADP-ribosylation factor-like protein 2-binding protein isoform X1 [Frieseomelitta varia]KAF3428277.1 hypothetical protein E2986_09147 [Frieseomelitta varia]